MRYSIIDVTKRVVMNFKKSIVLVFFAMVAVGGIAQQSINGANKLIISIILFIFNYI